MRDALGNVQSVLVLGGRSEIALATIALLQHQRLERVVLAVRDVAAAESDIAALRERGIASTAIAFDAAATQTHDDFVKEVMQHGDIDLVIVAFGVLGDQDIADHDRAHALDIVHTNFNGAVSVLIPLAARLKAQGHGTIAVLSSVAAMRPRRANFVYASSKAGLDSFTRGLADAYAGTGVHIMLVRPGFVATRMTDGLAPTPFATTPDVVAEAIVNGIRKQSGVVYAPSVLQFVMPVLTSVPRFVWRKLGDR